MSSPEPIDAESAGRKLRYLKGTELFRDFTRAQLEPFHHTIRMETCRAGYVFYRPGETGEVMFLLKEGGAQLYRLAADGRKFVFADVPPSSIFGEMACIGQGMYECFAEATADSVICTLTRADVQRLIVAYPQFALRLIETMGRRMVEAERQLEELAFKTVVPRLAAFLHREARRDRRRMVASGGRRTARHLSRDGDVRPERAEGGRGYRDWPATNSRPGRRPLGRDDRWQLSVGRASWRRARGRYRVRTDGK